MIYDAYERDFITLAPLMDTHAQLRAYMLDDDLCWLLPATILPGVTSAYGLPVLRVLRVPRPGVDEPMLAHRARGHGTLAAQPDRPHQLPDQQDCGYRAGRQTGPVAGGARQAG